MKDCPGLAKAEASLEGGTCHSPQNHPTQLGASGFGDALTPQHRLAALQQLHPITALEDREEADDYDLRVGLD
ncbi:MAG: hypothetical protein IPP58_01325 [Holophagaceae bacterium]|uniref:Uncharacterized protein n=1 Tax=Candidatus Geothrix skivensis TaxID=2954439 RepID=A0A9D7XGM1_9BACT|nr:hypothetical protein [Candidatus Geothrix skivensis]